MRGDLGREDRPHRIQGLARHGIGPSQRFAPIAKKDGKLNIFDEIAAKSNCERGQRLLGAMAALLLAILWMPTALAESASFGPVPALKDYRGNVVLLDFWASWCVPCRRSFPWMNRMQEKYAEDGLVILAVNLDKDPVDAEAFLQKFPANFNLARDPAGHFARQYGVVAMPSSYVIDRNGNIAAQHLGFKVKKQTEYEETLKSILEEDGN